MADDDRPHPSPRPRRGGAAARPSPRPRVAGARRDRDESRPTPSPRTAETAAVEEPLLEEPSAEEPSVPEPESRSRRARARRERPVLDVPREEPRRRGAVLPVTLLVLVLVAAAAAGWLLWERLNPSSVDAAVLDGTREAVEALYAYDYRDSEGSVEGKLAVLTGDLREQYAADLEGGIIDTYEQVSATTRYEIDDVGLKRINQAQYSATVVVFGSYVIDSVTSGEQPAPEDSGCEVTTDGEQSCTQILRLVLEEHEGDWKIADYAVLAST